MKRHEITLENKNGKETHLFDSSIVAGKMGEKVGIFLHGDMMEMANILLATVARFMDNIDDVKAQTEFRAHLMQAALGAIELEECDEV